MSVPFASSTVITPSLLTLFIASAINFPIVLSLLAEIVATCSIFWLLSPTFFDCFFKLETMIFTALSIPLLRSMGLAPAATFFRPFETIDCAKIVAVVVPSPA